MFHDLSIFCEMRRDSRSADGLPFLSIEIIRSAVRRAAESNRKISRKGNKIKSHSRRVPFRVQRASTEIQLQQIARCWPSKSRNAAKNGKRRKKIIIHFQHSHKAQPNYYYFYLFSFIELIRRDFARSLAVLSARNYTDVKHNPNNDNVIEWESPDSKFSSIKH